MEKRAWEFNSGLATGPHGEGLVAPPLVGQGPPVEKDRCIDCRLLVIGNYSNDLSNGTIAGPTRFPSSRNTTLAIADIDL